MKYGQYGLKQTYLREIEEDYSKEIEDTFDYIDNIKKRLYENLKLQRKDIQTLRNIITKNVEILENLEDIYSEEELLKLIISNNISKNIKGKNDEEIEDIITKATEYILNNTYIVCNEESDENLNESKVEEIREVLTKKDFTIIENLKKIYTNIYMIEKQKQDIDNFKNISPYIVYIIYNILKEKIEFEDMCKLYYDIELPCVTLFAKMQYYGIYLDKEELFKAGQVFEERKQELQKNIEKYSEEEININSVQQIGVLLFEKLGLPIIRKTKTGYSTDVDTLKKLEDKHEIISYILEYREISKLISTYVEGLIYEINEKTNRIHSNFNQTVTATGRISSTEPNMQNIPARKEEGKIIRKCFKAEKGNVFVSADYSQIELRVLADMSR